MALSRYAFVDLAAFAGVLAVAAIGGLWAPEWLPKAEFRVVADVPCDLNRGACASGLPDGGSLEVELTPRPIPLVKPVGIVVRGLGGGRRVWADFAGVGMNMGENRPELSRGADGVWHGETTLPVCISGAMQWDFTLIIESPGRRVHIPYRFATHAHPETETS